MRKVVASLPLPSSLCGLAVFKKLGRWTIAREQDLELERGLVGRQVRSAHTRTHSPVYNRSAFQPPPSLATHSMRFSSLTASPPPLPSPCGPRHTLLLCTHGIRADVTRHHMPRVREPCHRQREDCCGRIDLDSNLLGRTGRRRKTRDAQRGTSCGPCTVQPPALPAPELAASRSRALCVKPEACGGVAPEVGQALLRSVFKPCPSLPPRYVSWPPFYSVKRDQKMANRRIVEST